MKQLLLKRTLLPTIIKRASVRSAECRNGRPVIVAVSTNDALAGAAENIGKLLGKKHYYFVPFGQDNPKGKPTSMVAAFEMIPQTLEAALSGQQLQPILL